MDRRPAFAEIRIADEDAMLDFGERLAEIIRGGDIIALSGDLGAGKSTLARAVISAALATIGLEAGDIPSPTFTLVQHYPFPDQTDPDRAIWHMDLWRLESADEIWELGFEDAVGRHACLIEWPEKIAALLPGESLIIRIEPDGMARRLSFHVGANPPASARASSEVEAAWRQRLAIT